MSSDKNPKLSILDILIQNGKMMVEKQPPEDVYYDIRENDDRSVEYKRSIIEPYESKYPEINFDTQRIFLPHSEDFNPDDDLFNESPPPISDLSHMKPSKPVFVDVWSKIRDQQHEEDFEQLAEARIASVAKSMGINIDDSQKPVKMPPKIVPPKIYGDKKFRSFPKSPPKSDVIKSKKNVPDKRETRGGNTGNIEIGLSPNPPIDFLQMEHMSRERTPAVNIPIQPEDSFISLFLSFLSNYWVFIAIIFIIVIIVVIIAVTRDKSKNKH